jgi:hypothetical protein
MSASLCVAFSLIVIMETVQENQSSYNLYSLIRTKFLLLTYCDMTPENLNSSLLGNGGKQVPAEMYTQATVEELRFLCNGELNIPL